MLVANEITRADTRSWTTLPALIDLTHFNVNPGCHTVNISVVDKLCGVVNQSYQIKVKPNDLCIVHVFNIHPGLTRVLIPSRYLVNPGDFQ